MLGGDINFSLGLLESWGFHAQQDPLSAYFENFLELHNLLDIPSTKLMPTRRSNRAREDSQVQILDRFLIKEGLLTMGLLHKQWVGSGGVSDHLPIFMEIKGGPQKPRGPFKFSSSWLKDPSFIQMIKKFWKAHPPNELGSITEGFSKNLRSLKNLSKIWAHKKLLKDDETLLKAEKEIADLENDQI